MNVVETYEIRDVLNFASNLILVYVFYRMFLPVLVFLNYKFEFFENKSEITVVNGYSQILKMTKEAGHNKLVDKYFSTFFGNLNITSEDVANKIDNCDDEKLSPEEHKQLKSLFDY